MNFTSWRSVARISLAASLFLFLAAAEAQPTITNFYPNPYTAGEVLTIQGRDFGDYPDGALVLNGTNLADVTGAENIITWNDTNITCQIYPPYLLDCYNTIEAIGIGGIRSAPYPIAFTPTINAILSLDSGPTAGGTSLELSGADFVTNMLVLIGNSVASNIAGGTSSAWAIVTPPGDGIVPISLVACGVTNATGFNFSYNPPAIESVQPFLGSTMGGAVTIDGDDFGTNGTVTLGGENCPILNWSDSQIIFLAPPGQGADNVLQVTVATNPGYQATVGWSYAPPIVTRVSPSVMDPIGGPLTIEGTNFGISGTVTVGGVNCPALSWGQTQIVCSVPPGSAASAPIMVTVGGQAFVYSFGYAQPLISSVNPSTGPTLGGTLLVISGSAFGPSGTVTVGGRNCAVSNWSDSQIACVLPAGQGANQPLVVTDGTVSAPPFAFSYLPPSIFQESPPLLPTAGGAAMTIVGTNFGTSGSVSLGSSVCPINTWSQTQVSCVSPAGVGAGLPLIVTVAGQASSPLAVSYYPPSITNLAPNTAPTSGGTLLIISGSNFGTAGTVTIGATPCPIITWTNSQVLCIAPAGTGTGLELELTVGSQQSNPEAFSYYSTNTPCLPGTYSATGFQPGVPAPPGYYVASSGATNPTPADPGWYVPTAGAISETPAPPGFYCPVAAMTSPIAAAPGYYVPTSGATAQIPSPAGQYVPFAGSSAFSPPPPGTFAPIMGMQGTVFLGSTNGSSAVSQGELDLVLSNYWPNSPWIALTNFQHLPNGLLQFALTNQSGWDFSVLSASNLSSTNWSYVGVAYPVYQFIDTNTNAASQYYKLRWP